MRIVRGETTSLAKLPPMPRHHSDRPDRHGYPCRAPQQMPDVRHPPRISWDINESRMGASKISVSPIDGISSPRRIGGSSLVSNSSPFRGRARSAFGGQPLTKDEARRMAANFAKLPELLRWSPSTNAPQQITSFNGGGRQADVAGVCAAMPGTLICLPLLQRCLPPLIVPEAPQAGYSPAN